MFYLFAFIILFTIAIPILIKVNKRSAVSISTIVKKLDIPADTLGFLSGHSVFTKNYVILSDELVYIPNGKLSNVTRIRYSDITEVKLRGWVLLYFRIRTKDGKGVSISPISRFLILSQKNVSNLEEGEMSANPLNSRSDNVMVVADTVGNYMRYTASFRDFIRALNSKDIAKQVTQNIGWGWTGVRRAIGSVVISIIILILITWIVLVVTGDTIKF